jgi:hypothetical protein
MSDAKLAIEMLEADLEAFKNQYAELQKAEQQIAAEKAKLEMHFKYVTVLKARLEQKLSEMQVPQSQDPLAGVPLKEQLEQAFTEKVEETKVVEKKLEVSSNGEASNLTEEVKTIKETEAKESKKASSTKTAKVTNTKTVKPAVEADQELKGQLEEAFTKTAEEATPTDDEDWGDSSSSNTQVFSEDEEDEWAEVSAASTSRTTNAHADKTETTKETPTTTTADDDDDWGS